MIVIIAVSLVLIVPVVLVALDRGQP